MATQTGATPEQVEAAARRLCAVEWRRDDRWPDGSTQSDQEEREYWRTSARAALAAVIPPGAVISSAEREAAIARLAEHVCRASIAGDDARYCRELAAWRTTWR